jgi:hypothetical protein
LQSVSALPTAIAAFSTLFFSFSSSNSVQEEFKRENQTREKELCVVSVLVKVEAFFFKAFP